MTSQERTIYLKEHDTWLTTFADHDEFIAKIDNQLFKTIAVLGLSLDSERERYLVSTGKI